MLNRVYTIVLLVFLALLQGVGPLLHAHRDGAFVRTGTHIHFASIDLAASAARKSENTFRVSEAPEIGLGLLIERKQSVTPSQFDVKAPVGDYQSLATLILNPASVIWDRDGALAPRVHRALPPPSLAPPLNS
jgi:hypothetical protein